MLAGYDNVGWVNIYLPSHLVPAHEKIQLADMIAFCLLRLVPRYTLLCAIVTV